jgi:hypothetical protein
MGKLDKKIILAFLIFCVRQRYCDRRRVQEQPSQVALGRWKNRRTGRY